MIICFVGDDDSESSGLDWWVIFGWVLVEVFWLVYWDNILILDFDVFLE